MVWEVVVVFNWGEGCRFAEETEVVYWSRVGEEGLNCCGIYMLVWYRIKGLQGGLPSRSPRPLRRMGTREMVVAISWVV